MKSRSSTPDTRIFDPTSAIGSSVEVITQLGGPSEHDGAVGEASIGSSPAPSIASNSSETQATTLPSGSSALNSPHTLDCRSALHSHPTFSVPGHQDTELSRKDSTRRYDEDERDDESDRLSTIPEQHSPSLSDKSQRSVPPNFSRPLSIRDSHPTSVTDSYRLISSPLVVDGEHGQIALATSIRPAIRPASRSTLTSISESPSSNKARFSSSAIFGLSIDDDEVTKQSRFANGGDNSGTRSDSGHSDDTSTDARPAIASARESSSSQSASTSTGPSPYDHVLGSDGNDSAMGSSGSSRRYPPSLASDYAVAPAPSVNRVPADETGSAKSKTKKTRPHLHGRSFSASDYDTSELSEKELQKLRKKGIDPALYLEMKAAKGKKGKRGTALGHAPL